jgi:hypothetical protein
MYEQQSVGQPFNPYAPPVDAAVAHAAPGGFGQAFWRQGDDLVVRKGAVLPDRCIATGVPTHGNAVTKQLTWIPPWVGILFVGVPYRLTKIDEEHLYLKVKPEFWVGMS